MKGKKVYVLEGISGRIKIGSSANPDRRATLLGADVRYVTQNTDDAHKIEKTAHALLKIDGKHFKGEWFSVSVDDAIAVVKEAQARIEGGEDVPKHFEAMQITLPPPMRIEIERRMAERGDAACISTFIRELLAKGLEA